MVRERKVGSPEWTDTGPLRGQEEKRKGRHWSGKGNEDIKPGSRGRLGEKEETGEEKQKIEDHAKFVKKTTLYTLYFKR